jgi:hypothetical protein
MYEKSESIINWREAVKNQWMSGIAKLLKDLLPLCITN